MVTYADAGEGVREQGAGWVRRSEIDMKQGSGQRGRRHWNNPPSYPTPEHAIPASSARRRTSRGTGTEGERE